MDLVSIMAYKLFKNFSIEYSFSNNLVFNIHFQMI